MRPSSRRSRRRRPSGTPAPCKTVAVFFIILSTESGHVSGKTGNCLLVQETECPAIQEINCFVSTEFRKRHSFLLNVTITDVRDEIVYWSAPWMYDVGIASAVAMKMFFVFKKEFFRTFGCEILSRTSNSLFFDFILNGYKKPANSQFLEYELAG